MNIRADNTSRKRQSETPLVPMKSLPSSPSLIYSQRSFSCLKYSRVYVLTAVSRSKSYNNLRNGRSQIPIESGKGWKSKRIQSKHIGYAHTLAYAPVDTNVNFSVLNPSDGTPKTEHTSF